MGFEIQRGGLEFKNAPGKGRWKQCVRNNGAPLWTVGSATTMQVPQSIENGFRVQGRRGAAASLGIRILGTVNCDNTGGATTLYMQKVQFLSRFKINLITGFQQPYWSKEITLGDLFFAAQIANLPVTMLDRQFFSDQTVGTAPPKEGPLPKRFAVIDTTVSGMSSIGTFRPNTWPTNDQEEEYRDSFWRVLEDRILIRQATAAATAMDFFVTIPLCVRHMGLLQDTLPLALLANPEKPWTVQLTYDGPVASRLIGFNGGSIEVSAYEMWVYVIPQRADDEMFLGRPWYMRFETFAAPYKMQPGELVLATYTAPNTRSNETYTVDGQAYVPGVEYPNVNPDFTIGNQMQWFGANGVTNFPDDTDDQNPRNAYQLMWNLSRARPMLHTGLASEVFVYTGTSITGTRGYTTTALPVLDDTLGPVSTLPIRVITCLLLDVEGLPGLASQDANCNRPYVNFAGSFDFTSTNLSSMAPVVVLAVNNSPADEALLKNLAANCCARPNVTWVRQAAGSSAKAAMVGDIVGGWVSQAPPVTVDANAPKATK